MLAALDCTNTQLAGLNSFSAIFGIFEAFHGLSSMLGNFVAIGVFSMFANQILDYKAAMLSMGIWSAIGAFLMLFCYREGLITDDTETPQEEVSAKRNALKEILLHVVKIRAHGMSEA